MFSFTLTLVLEESVGLGFTSVDGLAEALAPARLNIYGNASSRVDTRALCSALRASLGFRGPSLFSTRLFTASKTPTGLFLNKV